MAQRRLSPRTMGCFLERQVYWLKSTEQLGGRSSSCLSLAVVWACSPASSRSCTSMTSLASLSEYRISVILAMDSAFSFQNCFSRKAGDTASGGDGSSESGWGYLKDTIFMRSRMAKPSALCMSATCCATRAASSMVSEASMAILRELYTAKYLLSIINVISGWRQLHLSVWCWLELGNIMSVAKHPLAVQYKEDAAFKKEMDDTAERYQVALQTSLYSNLEAIPKNLLTLACGDNNGHSVFLYMGALQPQKPELLEKAYLYMIRRFDDELFNNAAVKDKSYSLLFNNAGCPGSTAFSNFRLMFRTLPLQYFLGLKQLVILHGNLAIKANEWLVRGTINKYLKSKTLSVGQVQELEHHNIQVTPQLMEKFDERTLEARLPESYMLQATPPETIKKVRYGYAPEEKRITHKESSELDIDRIFYGKNLEEKPALTELELSSIKVPVVIESLVLYMRSKPNFLLQEGIFRKSPSIDDEKEALLHLYHRDYDFIETIEDAHLLASLIKKILMSLSEPLFPFELYDVILSHDIGQEQHWFFSCLLKKLPEPNYNTLLFLLRFFVEDVVPQQAFNKMTIYNVGVVLAPCLLRTRTASMMDIQYAGHLVLFLTKLIEHFWDVFGDRQRQELVFRKSIRKTEKIVQRRLTLSKTEPEVQEADIDKEIESELKTNNSQTEEPLAKQLVQVELPKLEPTPAQEAIPKPQLQPQPKPQPKSQTKAEPVELQTTKPGTEEKVDLVLWIDDEEQDS